MATLFVDKIDPQSGTTLSLGSSGDTLQATAGTTNNLGISMADQWRLTANVTSDGDITANLERVDDASFSKIGTGMTETSGEFTFSQTGLYLIQVQATLLATSDTQMGLNTFLDVGSGYDKVAQIDNGVSTGNSRSTGFSSSFINVTNTSTCKAKFTTFGFSNSSQTLMGNSDHSRTAFTFIKLGDSQ